jgi:hypothetical protein
MGVDVQPPPTFFTPVLSWSLAADHDPHGIKCFAEMVQQMRVERLAPGHVGFGL